MEQEGRAQVAMMERRVGVAVQVVVVAASMGLVL